MSLQTLGTNILEVEVLNIDTHGFKYFFIDNILIIE